MGPSLIRKGQEQNEVKEFNNPEGLGNTMPPILLSKIFGCFPLPISLQWLESNHLATIQHTHIYTHIYIILGGGGDRGEAHA